MIENSARFAPPFILPGQAQKEAFHNEALALVDAALHACVAGDPTADEPIDPTPGHSWIVGIGAVGAWAGRTDNLATWTPGGWRFLPPIPGMSVWNFDAGYRIHWTGTAWSGGEWPVSALSIGGQQVVGSRLESIPSPSGGTIIDREVNAAVAAVIVALRTHGLIE